LTINEVLKQLESQRASLERAINALREVSGSGLLGAGDVSVLAEAVERTRRRGRPASGGMSTSASNDSAQSSATKKRAPANKRKMPVYSDEFRQRVVTAVRNGMSFGEAARKYKTTWFSVREWVNSGRFEPVATAQKTAVKAVKKSASRPKKATAKRQRSAKRTSAVKVAAKAASAESAG